MNQRAVLVMKRIFASFCLFTGMLAITNLETFLHQSTNGKEALREQNRLAKESLLERLKTPVATVKAQSQSRSLRESLAQDEFTEANPFASLASVDPLNAIFQKGVKEFERSTYRSPNHQGESGYDVVQYEIKHPKGGHSVIMAYLERPMLTASRNVGTLDERIPFVVVIVDKGELATYSYYRSGSLLEQSEIPWSEAQGLVAQRINASIPFLSVSR